MKIGNEFLKLFIEGREMVRVLKNNGDYVDVKDYIYVDGNLRVEEFNVQIKDAIKDISSNNEDELIQDKVNTYLWQVKLYTTDYEYGDTLFDELKEINPIDVKDIHPNLSLWKFINGDTSNRISVI